MRRTEIQEKELIEKGWNACQVEEQKLALNDGNDLSNLDPGKWSYEQMRQQRKALKDGVDLSSLDPDEWTAEKMYDLLNIPKSTMRKERWCR